MDCTGHEIIISSGPHPAPRIQEIALFSTQNNPWTQALAQILWPFERLDFPRPPKSLSTLKWPSCKRAVRNMWQCMGDTAAGGSASSRRLLFFHGLHRPCNNYPFRTPTRCPTCWQLLCLMHKLAFERFYLHQVVGPFKAVTFREHQTR